MTDNKTFKSGLLAGFLLAMAAQAVYWLITPVTHPDASALRTYAVIAQALLCLGISLWLIWRQQLSVPQAV